MNPNTSGADWRSDSLPTHTWIAYINYIVVLVNNGSYPPRLRHLGDEVCLCAKGLLRLFQRGVSFSHPPDMWSRMKSLIVITN